MIADGAAQSRVAVDFSLHQKQSLVLRSGANEILFGGAAGPGKSHMLRVLALLVGLSVPGTQIYLFRRTYQELIDSQVEGPRGLRVMIAPLEQAGILSAVGRGTLVEFANGSRIRLTYCANMEDVQRYQSAEIHLLLIDELTQIDEAVYRFLRGRVRAIGLPEMPGSPWRAMLPRIVCATNPIGRGLGWVKKAFVDPAPPMRPWRTPKSEGGMLRQFIPALLDDNPSLLRDDPTYLDRLSGIGGPDLVRAMREGDWNVALGSALHDVLDQAIHFIPPFEVPSGWRVDRSMDWGSAHPYAVCWWAEADGRAEVNLWGAPRVLPAGSLVCLHELYGWTGKPNEGCRMLAVEVGRRILEVEKAAPWGRRVQAGPADSAIFAVDNGRSISDDFASVGVGWQPCLKGPGSRVSGLESVRRMLTSAKQRPKIEEPCLVFFDTCRQSWRTLSELPRDDLKIEDVDTSAEDHLYDAIRYRATMHRAASARTSTVRFIGV